MRYRQYPPPAALAASVECLWVLEGRPNAAPSRVVPDGHPELIVHLGTPFHRRSGAHAEADPRLFLFGQLSRPIALVPAGPVRVVAARLRAGALARLAGCPASELTDRPVPLDELWGTSGCRPWQELSELDLDAARRRLEGLLLARLGRIDDERTASDVAIELLRRADGALPIHAVSAAVGLSMRQLQRRFRATVGLTPKRYARVVRIQAALRRLATQPVRWADLAADLGFADQAHLVREFRALTSASPRQTLSPAWSPFGAAAAHEAARVSRV